MVQGAENDVINEIASVPGFLHLPSDRLLPVVHRSRYASIQEALC